MNDVELKNVFCPKPFEYLDVHFTDGEIRLYSCCPTWLPEFVPAKSFKDIGDLWNAPSLQRVRASILDGSYKYCNKELCPEIQGNTLHDRRFAHDPQHRKFILEGKTELAKGPRIINFSEDRTCNLTCPSCRSSIIKMGDSDLNSIEYFHENLLPNLLKDAEFIYICSAGDPFASPLYRKLLFNLNGADYPKLNINIITNGVLLEQQAWESMSKIHGNIHTIFISLDAATDSTYKLIRRGGDFEKVQKNIEFLVTQRKKGLFKSLQLDFVVQDTNFKEMPEFVELGKKLDVDKVYFQRISNWGTYSDAEFNSKNILDISHPDHQKFLQVCQNRMMGDAIVKRGNLSNYLALGWRQKVLSLLKKITVLRYLRIIVIKSLQNLSFLKKR